MAPAIDGMNTALRYAAETTTRENMTDFSCKLGPSISVTEIILTQDEDCNCDGKISPSCRNPGLRVKLASISVLNPGRSMQGKAEA
jgi:hypothetical protein